MKRAIMDYFSESFEDVELETQELDVEETEKTADEDPECEVC